MKKFFYALLTFALVLASSLSVSAAVGDTAGEVLYTDIAAYVNHYPIPSYAYDGGTVVVVEDLRNYGFDVEWNADAKSLNIVPASDAAAISGQDNIFRHSLLSGQYFTDALYTDINVYLNGQWVPSAAINGYTIVKLEDLANDDLGISFTWDNATRSAKLWIDWAGMTEYQTLNEDPDDAYIYQSRVVETSVPQLGYGSSIMSNSRPQYDTTVHTTAPTAQNNGTSSNHTTAASAAQNNSSSGSSSSSNGSSYRHSSSGGVTYTGTVYVTPTGKRYHYSAACAGKNAIPTTLSEASARFTPCKKCVL